MLSVQVTWNHLFMILHESYGLSHGPLFRVIHTNYLLQVTLLKIALGIGTITTEI